MSETKKIHFLSHTNHFTNYLFYTSRGAVRARGYLAAPQGYPVYILHYLNMESGDLIRTLTAGLRHGRELKSLIFAFRGGLKERGPFVFGGDRQFQPIERRHNTTLRNPLARQVCSWKLSRFCDGGSNSATYGLVVNSG